MVLGDVVCAWLLLKGAEVAASQLTSQPGKDTASYKGKVTAAQFLARTTLPRISAERATAEAVDLSLMDLDGAVF